MDTVYSYTVGYCVQVVSRHLLVTDYAFPPLYYRNHLQRGVLSLTEDVRAMRYLELIIITRLVFCEATDLTAYFKEFLELHNSSAFHHFLPSFPSRPFPSPPSLSLPRP